MRPKYPHCYSLLLLYSMYLKVHHSQAQPSIKGYPCTANKSSNKYPCQAYIYYQAQPPDYLDLASIGDLFNVYRLSISKASNISNPAFFLVPNQPLFVPISCGCYPVKNQTFKALSFANITYTFVKHDTFYWVSTQHYMNLTTYQSVEVVNPQLVPEDLQIGTSACFPIFCKCPNKTQLRNGVNFFVSYVLKPYDTLTNIASLFGVTEQSIVDVNGNNLQPSDTVFVPVPKLPQLNQPLGFLPILGSVNKENSGAVVGLGVALGICFSLLVLVSGLWLYTHRKGLF